MVIVSRLFAFMYISRLRRFLGVSWAGWQQFIPLLLFLFTLALGWPLWLALLWLLLFFVTLVGYALVRRLGYQRFLPDDSHRLHSSAPLLPADRRVSLRATGVFSLNDREDYVLQHRAEYWRVPLGKHIFMVQHRAGKFLYQVIAPENVLATQPGLLLFGATPQRALALTFLVTWGPEYAEYKLYYVGADNAPAPTQRRTVYLTFADEDTLQQVWRSLAGGREATAT